MNAPRHVGFATGIKGLNASNTQRSDFSVGRQRTGLRRALFAALALALVVPGALAGFALIYLNLQRTIDVDARVRVEKLADLLQAGLTLPLWQISPDSGKPLLEAVATDPSVASIEVLDPGGTRLLAFNRNMVGLTDPFVVKRDIAKEGEALGQVTVRYATSAAREDARRASLFLFSIILVQLVVSLGLIGAWLARRVLKPLDTLRASAEMIATGDLQTAVPALSGDEFGVLAARLDAMRNSLAQSVSQLEYRVEERTVELRGVNTTLRSTFEDLEKTQKRLVQSEKLASLGSLVAGVAHELNTPIGTGITLISTIADRCRALRKVIDTGIRRSELEAFLCDVERASDTAQSSLDRAAQLIQSFRQFAVDQSSSERRTFELAEITREMMDGLNFSHKDSPVRITLHMESGIVMDSYPGALAQVITNLVDNAIIHGFAGRADGAVDIAAQAAEGRVTLTVTDDGSGINPEYLSRIFDPFFTTRLGRGGSGLGLSIAYGLINGLLGGHVYVASSVGKGTTLTIELPLVAPQHAELGGSK